MAPDSPLSSVWSRITLPVRRPLTTPFEIAPKHSLLLSLLYFPLEYSPPSDIPYILPQNMRWWKWDFVLFTVASPIIIVTLLVPLLYAKMFLRALLYHLLNPDKSPVRWVYQLAIAILMLPNQPPQNLWLLAANIDFSLSHLQSFGFLLISAGLCWALLQVRLATCIFHASGWACLMLGIWIGAAAYLNQHRAFSS